VADLSDELRALRERAYGPGADIHDDPAALQRLRELEGQALAGFGTAASADHALAGEMGPSPADDDGSPAGVAAEARAGARSLGIPNPSTDLRMPYRPDPWMPFAAGSGAPNTDRSGVAGSTGVESADPGPSLPEKSPGAWATAAGAPGTVTPTPPATGEASGAAVVPTPWWRTRRTLLWLGALVVSVAIAIAATVWVSQGRADAVAVLSVDEDGAWPTDFFGQAPEGGLLFGDFFGLSVVAMPELWGAGERTTCLYVLEARPQSQMIHTVGCAAGDFPPTAAFIVPANAPEALQDRFPEGTALQFVQRGTQVFVYSHAP